MNTPPFLVAAALLFWGWQTDFLIWAGMMAAVVEGSRFIKSRWEFSDTDIERIWLLCLLLFGGSLIFLYTSEETINRAFLFPQWQPFIFLPAILVQCYSSNTEIPLKLSFFSRRQGPFTGKRANISYFYFAVCLLGASATNSEPRWFYYIAAILVSWALFSVKPKRIRTPVWITMMALVATTGFFAQRELHDFQSTVESALGNWLSGMFRRDGNMRESRTAIGQIGKLKLSGEIVWRLQPVEGSRPPTLLRELSFDSYKNTIWWSSRSDFVSVPTDTNDYVKLLPAKAQSASANIAGYLPGGRGILALPAGTYEMDDLPVAMETNSLGVAKVTAGPGLINFSARFGPGASIDSPTNVFDFAVPDKETNALAQIVKQLNLARKTDPEKLQTIQQFFSDNYTYTTKIGREHVDATGKQTPLAVFLSSVRSGHCEYFATATVLLLRQAGVPARYAVGYAVPGTSNSGNTFVIRERHAHAWALVYQNGEWIDFDTTPASWAAIEEERASTFEAVSDFLSGIMFQFSKWRWGKASYTKYLIWLLIPLVLFLVYRIVFNKRRHRRGNSASDASRSWPGMDSELYLIDRKLAASNLQRLPGETLCQWQARLEKTYARTTRLETIVQLHQRYRFDPNGLSTEERIRLRDNAKAWLAENPLRN